jgi:hypothetical protein
MAPILTFHPGNPAQRWLQQLPCHLHATHAVSFSDDQKQQHRNRTQLGIDNVPVFTMHASKTRMVHGFKAPPTTHVCVVVDVLAVGACPEMIEILQQRLDYMCAQTTTAGSGSGP